jgi:uncharacterized membrane protein YccC
VKGTWQTTSSGPSGGVVLAVIAALILIGSGAASAIASALVTILIIIGSIIGLAVAAGIGVLIWRVRSDRPGRPISARVVSLHPPEPRPQLSEPSKPAIGPAREVHLHLNVSPDQLAAIVRHYTEENQS